MSRLSRSLRRIRDRFRTVRRLERIPSQVLPVVSSYVRGSEYAARWSAAAPPADDADSPRRSPNPLWDYFSQHTAGPGLWKWEHYFDVYHRHMQRFVGRAVDVLEIGIYSGGSLGMWQAYFGSQCHVHGVDIEPACRAYAKEEVTVYIGDQADRSFWQQFKREVAGIDVLIDDGGHTPEQQTVTLEELLPHLRPGGVYLCEDVTGLENRFAAYAAGLVNQLNAHTLLPGEELKSAVTPFQQAVYAIHFYPFVVVIEKQLTRPAEFVAPRQGSEWQPFL